MSGGKTLLLSQCSFFHKQLMYVSRLILNLSYYRLFKQYILLVLVDQIYSALFRCIAAMGRTSIVAGTFGAFALLIHFALGGFVLSRGKNYKLNFLNLS